MAAVDVIKATTKTTRENAVQQWARLKHEHPETVSGSYSFRFPGQRGPARDQDALEEFQHNRFKRQLEQDVLSEKANSERQERADFCHELMHLRQE